MSEITRDDVKKLALLSRMEVDETATESLRADLSNILTFISKLDEVKTDGVVPMASTVAGQGTPERTDEITAEDRHEDYQTTAPSAEFGFYVVPRVVE